MHHPANACQDAETVIVFGITVPQGMLRSPDYNLYLLHRSYHTLYMHLDELVLSLCNFIETRGEHLAVPIPSYAPLVYHEMEPWGLISLKPAAVCAKRHAHPVLLTPKKKRRFQWAESISPTAKNATTAAAITSAAGLPD